MNFRLGFLVCFSRIFSLCSCYPPIIKTLEGSKGIKLLQRFLSQGLTLTVLDICINTIYMNRKQNTLNTNTKTKSFIAHVIMVLSSSTVCTLLKDGINVSELTLCTNKGSIIPLIAVIKWFKLSTWNWELSWDLLSPKAGGVQWSVLLTKDLSNNPTSSVQLWYEPLRFEVQMETSQ